MSQKLNLQSAPSILFLYGLSGVGKSYVGSLIGELAGWHVYHADNDLTEEMVIALQQQRPFDDGMRDRYFAIVAEKILLLRQQYKHLVVTQGAYKRRHRDYLRNKIPGMEMVRIEASDTAISARLGYRDEGISGASASALRLDFEPSEHDKVIVNLYGREKIIEQLNQYFPA